uniref:Periplasmic serine protease n=1 Tax=uncultured Flavobacteriia bacterium TaxID=212695 RepID=F4MMN1_9BACT|nr:serine protease, peptidase S1 family [uncultured bacterium]CBL87394.1 periplasmic serine protease [uncultured Flavobacteriia bacterium]
MKKFVRFFLASVMGGAMALLAYTQWLQPKKQIQNNLDIITPTVLPVNYSSGPGGGNNADFTAAAEKTLHAVVHVKNTTISQGYTSYEDLFFGRSRGRTQVGTGSGVIISSDGYIVTNNHVIQGAQSIEVTTNNNKTYNAELIGSDPTTDIALLKIQTNESLNYTTFGDSNTTKIGEWVLAVGNPFNLTSTVTAGIISAKSRDLSGRNTQSFIQTDAAVNPGNSGGALVNIYGDLIGINTAISSQTGSYIGYSFAVPSNIARKVVEDIMEYGNVQNGILGVIGTELNSKNSEELGIEQTEGFYVNDVQENSGAEISGIQKGDIIKSIDDIKISKFSDLKGFLNTKSPNDVVEVKMMRKSKIKIVKVKLEKLTTIDIPIIGTLVELKAEELKKYGHDYGLKLKELSQYYKEEWISDGVDKGSLITAINDVKLNTIADVKKALNKSSDQIKRITIIKNNGEKMVYRFR